MTRLVKIAAAIVLVLVAILIAAGEASLLFDPPDAKLGGRFRFVWKAPPAMAPACSHNLVY